MFSNLGSLLALLTACASIMFLATRNQICQGVAVVPFLWILPLASISSSSGLVHYLLRPVTLVLASCFPSRFWVAMFLACLVLKGWALRNIIVQMTAYPFTLFACCTDSCHRSRFGLPGVALAAALLPVCTSLTMVGRKEI